MMQMPCALLWLLWLKDIKGTVYGVQYSSFLTALDFRILAWQPGFDENILTCRFLESTGWGLGLWNQRRWLRAPAFGCSWFRRKAFHNCCDRKKNSCYSIDVTSQLEWHTFEGVSCVHWCNGISLKAWAIDISLALCCHGDGAIWCAPRHVAFSHCASNWHQPIKVVTRSYIVVTSFAASFVESLVTGQLFVNPQTVSFPIAHC